MVTCDNCHVSKEEYYGWWTMQNISGKTTYCPMCWRKRSLQEQLVRVNQLIMDAPADNYVKDIILYEVSKINNE